MRAARCLRLLDGQADRGVRRHLHEGELGRARDHDKARLEGIGGQRLAHETGEQILDLPEPAKRGCGDGMCEGAVAGFEAGECRFRARAGEGVVERLPLAQHRAQQIGGEIARLQPGAFRLRVFWERVQYVALKWSSRKPLAVIRELCEYKPMRTMPRGFSGTCSNDPHH